MSPPPGSPGSIVASRSSQRRARCWAVDVFVVAVGVALGVIIAALIGVAVRIWRVALG